MLSQNKWINANGLARINQNLVFNGLREAKPDQITGGQADGAYVFNIVQQYHGMGVPDEDVLQIIEWGLAGMLMKVDE